MTFKVIKYPLDLTGVSPTNLVLGEEISLPRSRSRAFSPKQGPFFANSFVLRSLPSGTPLVLGTDYKILYLNQEASLKANQPICSVVNIINDDYYGNFSYDYQVIGGPFSVNADAIQQAIDALEIDNRLIRFSDLLDAPVTMPPSPHLHHVDDTYGYDDLVEVMKDIITAVSTGNNVINAELLDRISRIEASVNQLLITTASNTQKLAVLDNRLTILERR